MKTYVIALTTYREIIRRPVFWLLALAAAVALVFFYYVPYYTFGEDIKMVKDQGLVLLLVCGLAVAFAGANETITQEIEGKTAITLLSKPIRRRDFILGKFAGIMAAVALLFVILAAVFAMVLFFKARHDALENALDVPTYYERRQMLYGMIPSVVLTYLQVMILCSVSVALATRFPVHLNIPICISIYLLGHLAPLMVQAAERNQSQFAGVEFVAKLLSVVLPGLEFFNAGAAISLDASIPWFDYVLPAFLYAVLYSGIAILIALFLFEDRDLA